MNDATKSFFDEARDGSVGRLSEAYKTFISSTGEKKDMRGSNSATLLNKDRFK